MVIGCPFQFRNCRINVWVDSTRRDSCGFGKLKLKVLNTLRRFHSSDGGLHQASQVLEQVLYQEVPSQSKQFCGFFVESAGPTNRIRYHV